MRLTSLFKMAMGTGAALLAVTVAPATAPGLSCGHRAMFQNGAAGLVSAITAANISHKRAISLAPGMYLQPHHCEQRQ